MVDHWWMSFRDWNLKMSSTVSRSNLQTVSRSNLQTEVDDRWGGMVPLVGPLPSCCPPTLLTHGLKPSSSVGTPNNNF